MTDQAQDPSSAERAGGPSSAGRSEAPSTSLPSGPAARVQVLGRRPEVLIAATFVGGFVLASILKRLAR